MVFVLWAIIINKEQLTYTYEELLKMHKNAIEEYSLYFISV